MSIEKSLSFLLLVGAVAGGCAAPVEADDTGEVASSDDEIRANTTLALRDSYGLRIELYNEIKSWGAYLKRASVRRGSRSFEVICNSVTVTAAPSATSTSLRCWKDGSRSSERLEFVVAKSGTDLRLESVTLKGRELAGDASTISGARPVPFALRTLRASASPVENPFIAGETLEKALAPLVGAAVWDKQTARATSVGGVTFSISEKFLAYGRVRDDRGAELAASLWFSLLVDADSVASGFADDATLAERARNVLPKAPSCVDGVAVDSAKTAIVNAFPSPLAEPAHGLSTKVDLGDLPAPVRTAANRASSQIRARRFAGTDYRARVTGIYAVHRSCADRTIVAYVVRGSGSGEPDYSDGIDIGIDLAGARIYEEVLDN
jgi:hypothetical protein